MFTRRPTKSAWLQSGYVFWQHFDLCRPAAQKRTPQVFAGSRVTRAEGKGLRIFCRCRHSETAVFFGKLDTLLL